MPPHRNDNDQAANERRAARIRAARAYADLDQPTIAQTLGVSTVTVKRMERGQREIKLEDLHAIAEVCGVPVEFMTEGFEAAALPPDTRQVIAAIEHGFEQMTERLSTTTAEAIAASAVAQIRDAT